MAEQKFDLKVAQLLDKTSIVVAGEGVGRLSEGSSILVIAIGPKLQGLSVPLVVPKAELVVDSVTKFYAIARSPEYETTVEGGFSALATAMSPRKVYRRDPLRVDEKQLVGNPGATPIAVGDPVILHNELSMFVDYLARVTEGTN
jgi:hypothetical protein